MNSMQRKKNAAAFAAEWSGRGYEKGELIVTEGLPIRPNLGKLFGDRHFAWVDLCETGDINAYQNRQGHYEG